MTTDIVAEAVTLIPGHAGPGRVFRTERGSSTSPAHDRSIGSTMDAALADPPAQLWFAASCFPLVQTRYPHQRRRWRHGRPPHRDEINE